MPQRWLSTLLVLFLLFGQSAAVVHAVGHLQAHQQANPCAAPTDVDRCGPAQDVCPTCHALAALAVAVPAVAGWLIAECGRRWHYPESFRRPVAPVFTPPARSRGPPLPNGLFR